MTDHNIELMNILTIFTKTIEVITEGKYEIVEKCLKQNDDYLNFQKKYKLLETITSETKIKKTITDLELFYSLQRKT